MKVSESESELAKTEDAIWLLRDLLADPSLPAELQKRVEDTLVNALEYYRRKMDYED